MHFFPLTGAKKASTFKEQNTTLTKQTSRIVLTKEGKEHTHTHM